MASVTAANCEESGASQAWLHPKPTTTRCSPLRLAQLLAAAVQPVRAGNRTGRASGSCEVGMPVLKYAGRGRGWERGKCGMQTNRTPLLRHGAPWSAPVGNPHRRMGPVSTRLLALHSMPACRPLSTRFRTRARGPRSSRACRGEQGGAVAKSWRVAWLSTHGTQHARHLKQQARTKQCQNFARAPGRGGSGGR